MINSISSTNIIHKKQRVSFGTISRTNYAGNKVTHRNDTRMFRPDLDWRNTTNYIIKKKPDCIYCYACSDGSEPYSIALSLINKLGYENAKNFFPIIARDYDSKMISRANNGIIKLDHYDFITLKKKGMAGYFKPVSSIITENDKLTFIVDDKLKKCVVFQYGDITKDIKKTDLSKSVLFFRNAFPYLDKNRRNNFLKNISEQMDDSSSFIMGAYDREKLALEEDNKYALEDICWESGLKQIRPNIFEKRNTNSSKQLRIKDLCYNFTEIFKSMYWDFREKTRTIGQTIECEE